MNASRAKQLSQALELCQSHKILGILEDVLNQMLKDEPADESAYFVSKLNAFVNPPVPTSIFASWCPISHLLVVRINVFYKNSSMAFGECAAKLHHYEEETYQSLLPNINSFLQTCKLEVKYQILLDRFLRDQYEIIATLQLENVRNSRGTNALPPKSVKQIVRNIKNKGDVAVPSTLLKPPPSLAILLTSTSLSFNFALTESVLPLSEGFNLRKELTVLSRLLNELKYQSEYENAVQALLDSKSHLPGLPQLALFPEHQKSCKCIREITIFPKICSDSYKTIFSRLYSEVFHPPVVDKMEQMLEFAVNFLRERNLENTFHLSLVCEPYAFYNEAKGKYELMRGVFKSADDLVNVYVNLLQAYPQIKVLTNPFRTEDGHAWLKLQEALQSLDTYRLVEICASSDAVDAGAALRLSPSPSISEMARLLNETSHSLDESERRHTFGVSSIIRFDSAFGAQTNCCLLLDIVEAILWVKYKQKKKIQICLAGDCAAMKENKFALAVAIAFGADYINFGGVGSTPAQVLLADWIDFDQTNVDG